MELHVTSNKVRGAFYFYDTNPIAAAQLDIIAALSMVGLIDFNGSTQVNLLRRTRASVFSINSTSTVDGDGAV